MHKIITDAAALTKAIAKVHGDSAKLAGGIQIALASGVYFAMKDGNIEPLTTLFTGMNKGVRRAAMLAWLTTHAPVVLNKDEKDVSAPFKFSRPKVAELIAEPMTAEVAEGYAATVLNIDWTEFKPEVLIPETFDVAVMVKQLLAKAKSLSAKGSTPKHADLLAKLQALTLPADSPAPL